MIRLILVRHGNTFEAGQTPVQVGARTDLPLTAAGRAQAVTMSHYLHNQAIVPKAVFAGNLLRQTESARIIAQSFGLSFLHEPALTEIDYGAWEGLTAEEIARQWSQEYADWERGKWPQGIFPLPEEEFMRPIHNWFGHLRATFREGIVLAITSNGLLRRFHNEKVKTGHYCELDLWEDRFVIQQWNINPLTALSSSSSQFLPS